jgi:hypothetical protein
VSKPKEPRPVKLIAGIFAPQKNVIGEALEALSERYGSPDFISEFMPFDYTDYYGAEMGTGLVRRFASFEDLVNPASLPEVKIFTNGIEKRFSSQGKRSVNIDPGYLSEFHLILATGKGYAHRPYLREGIYADLTLIYRNKAFHPLEWTYPDYRGEAIMDVLTKIREKYMLQLRNFKSRTPTSEREESR